MLLSIGNGLDESIKDEQYSCKADKVDVFSISDQTDKVSNCD
jgi:hypothetical protein